MMSHDFSQTLGLPSLLDAAFGRIVESGSLSKAELSILFELIRNRRSLPVYRGEFWACYECAFRSETLGTMAMHVMRVHQSAPFSEEELLEAEELEV
jgi:hypothetical protein